MNIEATNFIINRVLAVIKGLHLMTPRSLVKQQSDPEDIQWYWEPLLRVNWGNQFPAMYVCNDRFLTEITI